LPYYTKDRMPILKSSKKALRSSTRKAAINNVTKSRMRSAIKTLGETKTVEALSDTYRRVDRAVKSKLIHKNAAARLKSQASKLAKK